MGEIADMMLAGEMCEGCGVFLDGDAPGYPRRCPSCGGGSREAGVYYYGTGKTGNGRMPGHRQTVRDTPCPECGKMCRGESGVAEHRSVKHPAPEEES